MRIIQRPRMAREPAQQRRQPARHVEQPDLDRLQGWNLL
jgi:hypothetical protein